jgi:prohibitin 1
MRGLFGAEKRGLFGRKFHTKEGLEITADVTLLYHLKSQAAQNMYSTFGLDYGKSLVLNSFIAASREATLLYYAKDIITERENLEHKIRQKLESEVSSYGIVVDALLFKDIALPAEIAQAIQHKVKSEQDLIDLKLDIEKLRKEQKFKIEKDSLQLTFDLQKQKRDLDFSIIKQRAEGQFAVEKQKLEADRTIIEATALKKSQDIINSSITDKLIKYKSLDITKGLITSPNTKLIITDGRAPINLYGISDH